jgi:D-arginine dehydrogenase
MSDEYSYIIVGGGIVGAAVGFHLAPHGTVCVLEQESAAGYHSTGRSAALLSQNYGTPLIQRLTSRARAFLETPPAGFASHPLLVPRGMVYVGGRKESAALERLLAAGQRVVPAIHWISQTEVLKLCPVLKPGIAHAGVYEPDARDIDVEGLLQGYLRGIRRAGGMIAMSAPVESIARQASTWEVTSGSGRRYSAPVVVNAAGAWCDEVARLAGVPPIGLVPKRRTAITVDPPAGLDVHGWPMVYHVDNSLYIKPEAGRILACPADVTPCEPCDAQPDEYDVAVAAERLEDATTLKIDRIHRKWAGLRSFVEDGEPVVGEDPAASGFFWAAALGGYGVMTSPAIGAICASLIVHRAPPADFGADAGFLGPARMRR